MSEHSRTYSVKKVFQFRLKDGQLIEITHEDAEWIRDILNTELPKVSMASTIQSYKEALRTLKDASSEYLSDSSISRRKDVPRGFVEIARKPSQKRAGKYAHIYVYFKNAAGQYGFLIENHEFYRFRHLGSLDDPESPIGRLWKKIPQGQLLNKIFFVNSGLYRGNNRVLKAIIDILETEKYLEKRLTNDRRSLETYIRTKKSVRPGAENDHEPEKAIVTPSLQAALQ